MVILGCIDNGYNHCSVHKQAIFYCEEMRRKREAEEMKVFKKEEALSDHSLFSCIGVNCKGLSVCVCICHYNNLPNVELPRNPHYLKLIEKIKQVHESKSHDYAKDTNVFSNFEIAAQVAEIFTNPVDRVFATLIGVKLARLAELRSGKIPKNESLLDTIEDMTNYSAIWGSYIMRGMEEK